MVQVMGNRILGGIGAPSGAGMAESFGAGVNTALNQRTSRQNMEQTAQNMRINDQKMQWAVEDREDAKRRRAAAAATAAAAKTRAEAMAARYRAITSGASGAPTAAGLMLPRAGDVGPSPAPTPTAGLRPAPRSPTLSFGGTTVSGGGSTAGVRGGPGADDLTSKITNIQSVQGTLPPPAFPGGTLPPRALAGGFVKRPIPPGKEFTTPVPGAFVNSYGEVDTLAQPQGRPGDFAAQATQRTLAQPGMGAYRPELFNMVLEAQAQVARAEEQWTDFPSGDTLRRLTEAKNTLQQLEAEKAASDQALQPYVGRGYSEPRGILALEGPAATGQERPYASAPATANVRLPGGETLALPVEPTTVVDEQGREVRVTPGSDAAVTPAKLSFGPQLGSPSRTQEDVFLSELMSRTGNESKPLPLPPAMGQPGAPDRFVRQALAEREQQVQLAQAALEFRDARTYEAAASKIMELDNALEAGLARLAIQEVEYYNAPQRLSAIWSDYKGADIEFRPGNDGALDIYTNGTLSQRNAPLSSIREQTLAMTDATYAEQAAAMDQLRRKNDIENMSKAQAGVFVAEQQSRIDLQAQRLKALTQADIDQLRRDLGLSTDDKIAIEPVEGPNLIGVWVNGILTAQYRVAEELDKAGNPLQKLELMP